jgi:hypothetical protein
MQEPRGGLAANVIFFSCGTLLVRGVEDFYNPSNTAKEAVVLFIRCPGAQPPSRTVGDFAGKSMSLKFDFGNSQEH